MRKSIFTGLLVCSLVLAPFSGVVHVFADDLEATISQTQTEFSQEVEETVVISNTLVSLEDSSGEAFSSEVMEESSSNAETLVEETMSSESATESLVEKSSSSESTTESSKEEVLYEDVFYNGQWFQFPIQQEPVAAKVVDPNANHELGTFTKPRERGKVDVISEDQKGRPKWDFIDIASYQTDLSVADYEFMKKHGVTGVVVKLTEGTSYKNPYAANQIKNALAAGMKVSTYHFSHFATKQEAEAEATYYAKMAKELNLPGTTVMVNDIETVFNPYSTQNSVYFANKLKALGYGTTLHYSSSSIFDRGILSTAILGLKNLWVAQYPYKPTDKNILHSARSAWQWSDSMEFSAIKDSKGNRKRFDINMDHSGTLSHKGMSGGSEADNDVIPSKPAEKNINKYATMTKKGYSLWNDLSFKGEKAKSDTYFQQTLYVEKEYKFLDGVTLVSLKDNKGNFLGYIDTNAIAYGNNKGGAYLSDGRFVTVRSPNYDLWQNFNFSKSKGSSRTHHNQTLQARGKYNHFNGSTYYSLYSNNGTWLGYMNANGVREGKGKQGVYHSYGKYVTLKSNYPIWHNFSWNKKTEPTNHKDLTYLAKGVYNHFNGSRYLSLYDKQGKWLGYMNEKGTRLAKNQGGVALSAKFNTKIVKRNYTIWQNLNFSKAKGNSNQYLNQTLYVKVKYNHYNKATYYSLYNSKDQWLGYINKTATK